MLTCSLCGKRPVSEFDPLPAEGASLEGVDTEYWWHRLGCGRPTVVLRAREAAGDVASLGGSRRAAAGSAMLATPLAVAETSTSTRSVPARSDTRVSPPRPQATVRVDDKKVEADEQVVAPKKLEADEQVVAPKELEALEKVAAPGMADTPEKVAAVSPPRPAPPPPAPRRVRPPRPQLPIPKGTQPPVPVRASLAPADSVSASGLDTPPAGTRPGGSSPELYQDRPAAGPGAERSLWTSSRRLKRNDPAVVTSVMTPSAPGSATDAEVRVSSDDAEVAEQVVLSSSDREADVVDYRYARYDGVSDVPAGPPARRALLAESHLDLTDHSTTENDEAEYSRFRGPARLGGVQPQPRPSGVPTPWRTDAGTPRAIQSGRRASAAVATVRDDDEFHAGSAPDDDDIEVIADDNGVDIVADREKVVAADELSASPSDTDDAGEASSARAAPPRSGMFARPPLQADAAELPPGHGGGAPAPGDEGRHR